MTSARSEVLNITRPSSVMSMKIKLAYLMTENNGAPIMGSPKRVQKSCSQEEKGWLFVNGTIDTNASLYSVIINGEGPTEGNILLSVEDFTANSEQAMEALVEAHFSGSRFLLDENFQLPQNPIDVNTVDMSVADEIVSWLAN